VNDNEDLEGRAPFRIVILFQVLSGGTIDSHEQRHSGYPVSKPATNEGLDKLSALTYIATATQED
jgi:hypothetical protein